MAGESDWGLSSKYVGKTKQPPSEWEYSNQTLLDHMAFLRQAAGVVVQVPARTPEQDIQAERTAWQALRSNRGLQA
jgi:hypothetical protein